jgi:hypothetical protein
MQATYRGIRRPTYATPCISNPIITLETPPLQSLTKAEQTHWNQNCTTKANVSPLNFNTLSWVPTLWILTELLEAGGTQARKRLHSC